MPRRTVLLDTSLAIWLLLAALATLATGLPTPQDDNSSGPLPFIQFTKGGIRVNFGGYHAQAGLGGLLTGSKADGGLHASAGTPDGAHASAGLGGSLDGGPTGGLHARAGLGNGGPEAEAGLGGSLAGPQPQGELYANSSPGGYAVAADSANKIERAERRRNKNVQVIARTKKATDQTVAGSSASASASADTNAKVPSPSPSSSSSSASSSSSSSGTTVNAGAPVDDDEAEKSEHPARWYFKKRVRERAGPHLNKTSYIVIGSAPAQQPQQDAAQPPARQNPVNRFRQGIFSRAAAGADASADASVTAGGSVTATKYKSSTFFDDIFNIPISALNAVNQLLRNHVGKK